MPTARADAVAKAMTTADLTTQVRLGLELAKQRRYHQANILLRRALAQGAFLAIPQARRPLLSLFSGPLCSPAVLSQLLGAPAVPPTQLDGAVLSALHDGLLLSSAYAQLASDAQLDPSTKLKLLAMCCWEAGDPVHTYLHADKAEEHREGDPATSFLLMASATTLAAPERDSITKFAEQEALTILPDPERATEDRLFAALTLARTPDHADLLKATRDSAAQSGLLGEVLRAGPGVPIAASQVAATAKLAWEPRSESLQDRLQAVVAWRATLRTLGHPRAPLSLRAAAAHAQLPIYNAPQPRALYSEDKALWQRLQELLSAPGASSTAAAEGAQPSAETANAVEEATAAAADTTATTAADAAAPPAPNDLVSAELPRWVLAAPRALAHILTQPVPDSVRVPLTKTFNRILGES